MKTTDRPGYWNIWWTLSALFMALGIAAVVLEYLGVFHIQHLHYAIMPTLGVIAERVAVLPEIAETLRRIEGLLDARLPPLGFALLACGPRRPARHARAAHDRLAQA